LTLRGRQQLELSPAEYLEAQEVERGKLLRELLAILRAARQQNAPWYQWVVWRRERRHMHGLRSEKNEPVACPVPGCDDGHPRMRVQDRR
jgi:hypothetical protein